MRVLATNCSLRGRSGTEIVTIDLALGLRSRGHEVAVFAPLLGKSAEILRDQGIIATDRPEDLPWKPDVVHGHHNHVLAAALAYFPDVPALFVCHSSNYWFDGPLLFPRVRRFCSVDEACRARLVAELGCEKEEIELLPNAVDLDLFSPRPPLPARPRRGLLLTKNTAHIAAVRAAAQETGLELDEIGSPFGREVDDLHARLRNYDIVFATARMALEARSWLRGRSGGWPRTRRSGHLVAGRRMASQQLWLAPVDARANQGSDRDRDRSLRRARRGDRLGPHSRIRIALDLSRSR